MKKEARSFDEGINPSESREFSVYMRNYSGENISFSEIGECVAVAYDNVSIN